jgi:serine/threonine-protein kinase RsbW
MMMMKQHKPAAGRRWVEIPNEASQGMLVLESVVLELQLAGFPSRTIRLFEVAFTEALINAIRHGNQDDCQKMVIIEYVISAGQIELSIEDEGAGFDPAGVDDPTLPEHQSRPGGRGLLLIRSLVESVEYNSRGNRITIRVGGGQRAAA